MNNVKTQFSIKDLENLSGIKAHTIRIWEKRHALFKPKRTETNIRYYDLKSLQKVLNISFLNRNGYKVSKIAELSTLEISKLVREIALKKECNSYCIDTLKMSMLNFDYHLFATTYTELLEKYDFDFIFLEIFYPLLNDIGILWQTDSITPAHEHFIVELIKQKILLNTEKKAIALSSNENNNTYVLFLPENEIHELGLLFLNYKLAQKGCHVVYLGQSVPLQSLEHLLTHFNNITFISSFTVMPDQYKINDYLIEFNKILLNNTNNKFIAFGLQTQHVNAEILKNPITLHKSTKDVIKKLITQVEKLNTYD